MFIFFYMFVIIVLECEVNMKKIFIVLICVLLLCGCGNKEEEKEVAKVTKITCNDVRNIENAVIIDVRTKEEYDTDHIENAINVSSTVIKFNIKAHVEDLETPIIVYCQSGRRSAESADILVNLGYKNVYDMGSITTCYGEE